MTFVHSTTQSRFRRGHKPYLFKNGVRHQKCKKKNKKTKKKKMFCCASCSGYSHHQKLFRSHESGLSHNNLVSLRAFGQNHRRRRIYSLFSGTDEAATESLVNKRKFNSNTHMKSVNVFFFFMSSSHPFFFR